MSHIFIGFRILFLFVISVAFINGAASKPFDIGERLEYDLKWGFFPVGSAVLEVHPKAKINGNSCYLLKFSVRTNSFADSFYKVRTSIESYVKDDFSKSILYLKSQSEGKTKRQVEVKFDYQKGEAIYKLSKKNHSTVKIPDKVFDPLAIAYLFRFKEMKENKSWEIPTSDGKRFSNLNVRIGKIQKVSVPAGKFNAFEVFPEMKKLRGVFNKSPDGKLKVWYSYDSKRLPIKISSKVVVGSFHAELAGVAKNK